MIEVTQRGLVALEITEGLSFEELARLTAAPLSRAPGVTLSQAYICDAVRTPFGRYGGVLSRVRADDLAAEPLGRSCSAIPASIGRRSTM